MKKEREKKPIREESKHWKDMKKGKLLLLLKKQELMKRDDDLEVLEKHQQRKQGYQD